MQTSLKMSEDSKELAFFLSFPRRSLFPATMLQRSENALHVAKLFTYCILLRSKELLAATKHQLQFLATGKHFQQFLRNQEMEEKRGKEREVRDREIQRALRSKLPLDGSSLAAVARS